MSRVFVIVEHDDGRLVGVEGGGAVVVDMEREPVDEWLTGYPHDRLWHPWRYRLTLEFPDGFRYYTPARPQHADRPEVAPPIALPPGGAPRGLG